MPDKKLTDSEIIKAFECCYLSKPCEECPLKDEKDKEGPCFDGDIYALPRMMVELNNRLQRENEKNEKIIRLADKTIETANAEIERLKTAQFQFISNINAYKEKLKTAKAEAVKEFAERLKNEYAKGMNWFKKKESYYVDVGDIDNLLKEMVG